MEQRLNYLIVLKKTAQKELQKMPGPLGKRLLRAIEDLSENPRPQGYTQLREFDIPPYDPKDLYRIRVGDYRIIYTIDDNIVTVTVIKISHRSSIYKKR